MKSIGCLNHRRSRFFLSSGASIVAILFLLFLTSNAGASTNINILDDETGGNCSTVGIWDQAAKICTLTTDITSPIEIFTDGITLDGNGHSVTGTGTGIGVYNDGKINLTIKNLNVRQFSYGIYIVGAASGEPNNNVIENNNVTGNTNYGIYVYYSYGNTLSGNSMSGNRYNFGLFGGDAAAENDKYYDNNINTSNNVDGKPIYYIKNAVGQTFDSSTNAGIFYCIDCDGVTISGLSVKNNYYGIYLRKNRNSRVENVVAANNNYGIYLISSESSTLSGNILTANVDGVLVDGSEAPTLTGNTASSNAYGIWLFNSGAANISNNTTDANQIGGIRLDSSGYSNLTGNTATSNYYEGILLDESGYSSLGGNVTNNQSDSYGIHIDFSPNCNIYSNSSTGNLIGIFLDWSVNSMLSGNTATANGWEGIRVDKSGGSTLVANTMYANESSNFDIEGGSDLDFDNNIDASNLVDGNPIYYFKNVANQTIDSSLGNIGALYCINCNNVTFKNLTMQSRSHSGLFLWKTTNSTIEGVASWGNWHGIHIQSSAGNTIKGNSTVNGATGIELQSSDYNTIIGNGADSNGLGGIHLNYSSNNTVQSNNTLNNGSHGIKIDNSGYNNISNNNASSNSEGIYLRYGRTINNTVTGNIVENNSSLGIVLHDCNYNSVSGNQVSSNGAVPDNSNYSGFYLSGASNNEITSNTISDNQRFGLHLYSSTNNSIHSNQLLNNYIQAYVEQSSGNNFNLPEENGGNYWSDWDGTGSYVFYGGRDEEPTSDGDLIEKYKPILFIAGDDYVPVPVKFMTDFALLRDIYNPDWYEPADIETLGSYQQYNHYLDQFFTASQADQHKDLYDQIRDTASYSPLMYAKVFRNIADESVPLNKKTVIQYWFCYYFNDSYGWISEHEADWEMVQIILGAENQPERAVYSQHNGGDERNWNAVWGTDSHPQVFVAKGTHANYFEPGHQYRTPFDWHMVENAAGSEGDDLVDEWDARTGGTPAAENLTYIQTWLDFPGLWGEPPDGPRGPKFNSLHQWDNPLGWWNGHNTISVNDTAVSAEFSSSGFSQAASMQLASFNTFNIESQSSTSEPNLDNVPVLPPPPLLVNIYDSQGRRAGKDAAGTVYKEIPGSQYLSNRDGSGTALIRESDITDGYTFEIESQNSSPFSIKLNLPQFASNLLDQPVYNVSVPGPLKGRVIVSPAGSPQDLAMSLDTNGDGIFNDGTVLPANSTQSVDFTKPSDITDLNVTGTGPGSVTLSWTAPGDDGAIGTATSYEARYSTSAIVDVNGWTGANLLFDEPPPQAAGSMESYSTQDLPGGDYYFAVKAKDEVNLESGMSNTVAASIPISGKTFTGKAIATANGFTTIDVEAPYTDDGNSNGAALVEYKLSANSEWTNAGTVAHPATAFAINGLIDGSAYDVRVTYQDQDGVNNLAIQTINNIQLPARDHTPPVVTYGGPYYINSTSTAVEATYSDAEPSSGINTDSATASINGGAPVQCTAAGGFISCPVSGLIAGNNSVAVSISDNDGNTGSVSNSIYVEFVFYIRDDSSGGDCFSIGNWDLPTKTCTLSGNLSGARLSIESDGITLDGNNHTVSGQGDNEGVYIASRNNVTVRNLTVSGFDSGLYIYLSGSLTLTGNKLTGNNANFSLYGYEDHHFNHNIDTSNLVDGRPIYYVRNAAGQIFDSSTNAGTFYCVDCTNVTIKDLTPGNNAYGVFLRNTQNSRIENIIALNNAWHGIYLSASSANYLIGNTVSSAAEYSGGIGLDYSTNNFLTNNILNDNGYDGIDVWDSTGNNIVSNTLSGNGWGGMYVGWSDDNIISRNHVDSNGVTYEGYGIYMYSANNNSVVNNNFKSNFIQAEVSNGNNNSFSHAVPEGGNYWNSFDSPAEGCNNSNGDDFCDEPFVFNGGQDNLPWIGQNGWVDTAAPIVSNIKPSGVIYTGSTTISADYTDGDSGINTSSVMVTLDGEELPGCTATVSGVSCPVSGLDTGNHVIGGSVSDNDGNATPFSGSFTVYLCSGSAPILSLSTSAIYWASLADYYSRLLSVDFSIRNDAGGGDAFSVSLVGSVSTNGVALATILPHPVGNIGAGGSSTLTLKYNVPPSVGSFVTKTYATALDDCGNSIGYPAPLPG